MTCECSQHTATREQERKTLRIALFLNGAMFIVGMSAGWLAQSTGLMADALDMLADASAYAIALLAVSRGTSFKVRAARWSGTILLLLGVGILAEVAWKWMHGSEPQGTLMMAFSLLSLIVNVTVLRMLAPFRQGEVHLRATWIFTKVDVIANVGVLITGALVYFLKLSWPDAAIGLLIGAYVMKESLEILHDAKPEIAENL